MTPILLRIPNDLIATIDSAADLTTRNRSQFIRESILFYLEYFNQNERAVLQKLDCKKKRFLRIE